MPHFILEYTDNLKAEGEIRSLLKKVNDVIIAQNGTFPTAGIRSRAIEVTDYVVADGTEDDAFVHALLKIGGGRSDKEKKKVSDEIFAAMTEHFSNFFEKRYLALSFELQEFQSQTHKKNNIHKRYHAKS
ncbi:5-carboxymethyl-2-hydroxymuconate isomerase [Salipaludibacillus keqinensis]|uniref:5-carboxymethyl-2-hydroxymuconate isomerase n=1 Tax=Salipaludibacillus keqinensis TaxID=2045207 RepID=A0A323TJT1_9BACI|nr:5-carboxymethyl-2-hydroxymuconate Delta-isomerase [Salipaludibacillus keqinensis]PYZ94830.1 5-carboxymethyl-2-hydroxymuconate isomerase [Salipaludibacillus keqinensis]